MPTATVNIPSQVLNYANLAAFPVSGALKTIYIAEDTNLEYRWTGSAYQVLGSSGSVTVNNIGAAINGANSATPNDTDLVMSVESSVSKKNTWTQIKAFLKTYFDTIYTTSSAVATQIATAISGKEDVSNKSSSYTLSSTTTYANTKALVDGLATKEPLKGSDDNYVTDAQLVVIGNTSGTNSGDNATNSTSNSYADGKVADSITNGVTTIAPSQNAVFDALALKAPLNAVTDITSLCTITGWSVFTTCVITRIDLGNVYLINVYISGTSNSGTASVQLPFTSSINAGNISYAISNGTGVNGRVLIASVSDTIDWRASVGGAAFQNTGSKLVSTQLWLPKP